MSLAVTSFSFAGGGATGFGAGAGAAVGAFTRMHATVSPPNSVDVA